MSKRFLDGDLCKKSLVSIFLYSSGFRTEHDFIRCVDFTRIAASDTASNDVAN